MYPALKTVNPAGTVGLASSDVSLLFIVGIEDGCVGRRRCFYVCTFCIVYPLVAVFSRHHECLVDGVKVDVHLGPSPGGTFLQVLTSAHLSRTPPEDNGVVLFSRVTYVRSAATATAVEYYQVVFWVSTNGCVLVFHEWLNITRSSRIEAVAFSW